MDAGSGLNLAVKKGPKKDGKKTGESAQTAQWGNLTRDEAINFLKWRGRGQGMV